MQNFLAQGMDAVVILPVDTRATGPMTEVVPNRSKPESMALIYHACLPEPPPYRERAGK